MLDVFCGKVFRYILHVMKLDILGFPGSAVKRKQCCTRPGVFANM